MFLIAEGAEYSSENIEMLRVGQFLEGGISVCLPYKPKCDEHVLRSSTCVVYKKWTHSQINVFLL